jgi:nicotinamidase-related amidase
MSPLELLDRGASVLVVVDVQDRLLPAIHTRDAILPRIKFLILVAREVGVPVVVTEQYPKGLGPTVGALKDALGAFDPLVKDTFSCVAGPGFMEKLAELGRKQVVLCGIEAHVCVAQTAVELVGKGYGVWLASDAVSSRRASDAESAMKRLAMGGVVPTTSEAVAFEWLRKAGTPEFKVVQKLVKETG